MGSLTPVERVRRRLYLQPPPPFFFFSGAQPRVRQVFPGLLERSATSGSAQRRGAALRGQRYLWRILRRDLRTFFHFLPTKLLSRKPISAKSFTFLVVFHFNLFNPTSWMLAGVDLGVIYQPQTAEKANHGSQKPFLG